MLCYNGAWRVHFPLPSALPCSLDADIVSLMSKRVYDMAGVLGKGVKTLLNGEALPVSTFPE